MGTHTYGGIELELGRKLTEDELDIIRRSSEEHEQLSEWNVFSSNPTWGDVGTIAYVVPVRWVPGEDGAERVAEESDRMWLSLEVGGKVYDIPEALQALLDMLPPGAVPTDTAWGTFESDGEPWGIVVKRGHVSECEARTIVVGPDNEIYGLER